MHELVNEYEEGIDKLQLAQQLRNNAAWPSLVAPKATALVRTLMRHKVNLATPFL